MTVIRAIFHGLLTLFAREFQYNLGTSLFSLLETRGIPWELPI